MVFEVRLKGLKGFIPLKGLEMAVNMHMKGLHKA